MLTMSKAMRRVRLGARLLEEQHHFFWYRKIDTGRLRLCSSNLCMLGQLFTHCDLGQEILGLTDKQMYIFGFHASKDGKWKGRKKRLIWSMLTAAWKKLIREMLVAESNHFIQRATKPVRSKRRRDLQSATPA